MRIEIEFSPKRDIIGLIIVIVFSAYLYWLYTSTVSYQASQSVFKPGEALNLVNNHDFEELASQTDEFLNLKGQRIENLSAMPVYPIGYVFNRYHGWEGTQNSFKIITGDVPSGKLAMQIISSQPSGIYNYEPIAIMGKAYNYSVYAKGEAGSEIRLDLYSYDQNMQLVYNAGIRFNPTNEFPLDEKWQEYSCMVAFNKSKVSFVKPVLVITGMVSIDNIVFKGVRP